MPRENAFALDFKGGSKKVERGYKYQMSSLNEISAAFGVNLPFFSSLRVFGQESFQERLLFSCFYLLGCLHDLELSGKAVCREKDLYFRAFPLLFSSKLAARASLMGDSSEENSCK